MTTRIGFSALAVLFLAAAACGPRPSTPPADASTAPAPRPGVVVLDATAQQRAGIVIEPVHAITTAEHITAPGLIALDETRTARIGSLQEGLILEIRADVGARVRAHQLLATMHGHAVHDAWAGYRKAVAERRRLQKELAYATEAGGRAPRLYATKTI
jgi:multidrug efflux pump subunit AcrA (membrane-fusion protein)